MKLIGLTGRMGVGKSTAVDFLKEKYGERNVRLVKFAQPLYDIQEFVYRRISPVVQRSPDFIKDRFLLQFLGTDWGRNKIRESLWVDLWEADAKSALDNNLIVVSDDVRFDNEAETVIKLGGSVLEIFSHGTSDRIDVNAGIPSHSSEDGINPDLVEYAVGNDGTLEDYRRALNNIFNVAIGTK